MKKDLSFHITPIIEHIPNMDLPYINAKVVDNLANEPKPLDPPACFLGAWYRKAVSAKYNWFGIEGIITLGEFIEDPKRFGNDKRVIYDRQLDSPSIYMGGFAESESDAGLGWMSGYESKDDLGSELNYGSKKIAYRPFWRFIYSDVTDINGNVLRGSFNSWNVSNPNDFDYYYFPGDKIRMSVYSPKPDYLQLRIEVLETTTIEKYRKIREGFGLENNQPKTFYSPFFYSGGHGRVNAEYKRVNSIDQYGNEGFLVKPTEAKVTKAVWHEVYLFTKIKEEVVKVPFTAKRYTSMICPKVEGFVVENQNDLGGEEITISPKGVIVEK